MPEYNEWEINETINQRYQQEIKRLRQRLEENGIALESPEGRKLFREEVQRLNHTFFVCLTTKRPAPDA